jgi:hypothetical protein
VAIAGEVFCSPIWTDSSGLIVLLQIGESDVTDAGQAPWWWS